MAKKLIRDYNFEPDIAGQGFLLIKGNYRAEQILLVTNVTDNTIIYNFAQSGLGGGCLYFASSDTTVLELEADTSSMSPGDDIQIFVDDEYLEVNLSEALIDPVNKVRVSNPQNLIDTDFEYGLQPSKWETLELVNNIPTFYPTQSNYSVSDIVSIKSLADSDLITVTTQSAHGIPVGTPIDVRGLDSQTAEGKYLVLSVPTDTTFTYRAKSIQLVTKIISGPYTIVVPGEFYSSSDVKYSSGTGLLSDEALQSEITAQTDYVHGIEPGTSVYIANTIASRSATISEATNATAPDGRPYVDFEDTIQTINSSTSSLNETKEKSGIYYFKFNSSDVDILQNKILWPNSGLAVGDALLYTPPAGDAEINGLQRFQIYYVKSVDSGGITLCETTNGDYINNPVIDLTANGTYNYGRAELLLVYEIKRMYRGQTSSEPSCVEPPKPTACKYIPTLPQCANVCN